ncbi:MAG: hypothetical protein CM1200mP11_2690 [Nitrosopumilaceae archaeon]|nr:MAG: hypothetical protein CM1200mP11_2690 [Nitrosopumilaceae archaeon]
MKVVFAHFPITVKVEGKDVLLKIFPKGKEHQEKQ